MPRSPRSLALAAMLLAASARATPPEHADPTLKAWFRSLTIPSTGSSCCDEADCRPTDYRIVDEVYQVPIGDRWITVPRARVIRDRGNPVGRAVVCREGETIFCFVPAEEG